MKDRFGVALGLKDHVVFIDGNQLSVGQIDQFLPASPRFYMPERAVVLGPDGRAHRICSHQMLLVHLQEAT